MRDYRIRTPETRAAISAKIKASWADPEVRARRIAAQRASVATPESKAKLSAAILEAFKRPDVQVRHRMGIKLRYAQKHGIRFNFQDELQRVIAEVAAERRARTP